MQNLTCDATSYASLFVIGFFANMAMGIFLGRYRHRSPAVAWFQFATFCTAIINLGYAITGCTTSPLAYRLGYLLNNLGIVAVSVVILVYTMYLTDRDRWLSNFWVISALVCVPSVMWALLWGTDLVLIGDIGRAIDSGFHYRTFPNGPLAALKGAYIGITFAISLALAISYWLHIEIGEKRREIGMIVLSMMIPAVSGIIAEGILPNLGYKTLPLGAMLVTVTQIIIIYSMLKYGIYVFNVRSATSTVIRALPGGLIIIDHTGTIQFANQGILDMLGYKESELMGAQVTRLFASKTAQAEFGRLAHNASTEQPLLVISDTTLKRQDGHVVPVNINIANTLEEGKLVNTILVITDISQLKSAERALEREKASIEDKVTERTRQLSEAQAQLTASVSSLPFGFALINQSGEIVFSNNMLATYTGHDIPSDPAASKAALQEIAQTYREHEDILHCIELVRSKRHMVERNITMWPRFFRLVFLPVLDDDKVIATVWLIEDTTEAKALERSRDEFFSIASHELRTPLTAISGNASMMLNYYPDQFKDKELHQMMDDIHESSRRLIMIVNDFLDVSRLELGKVVLKKKEVDIETLIRHALREYEVTGSRRKLALTLEPPADKLPLVFADPDKTRQVIVNLIGNAIKFTHEGGVTVRLGLAGKNVKITVTDTGDGISPTAQHLLFHKFQQASNNILTRDATKGTGLGLYISRLLAEAMGGKVYLVHTELGKGSTFCFELPVTSTANATGHSGQSGSEHQQQRT